MTREQHDAATLAYIVRYIGKVLPTQREMAGALNSSGSRVNHSIARLAERGKIAIEGLGNCRVVEVIGVGRTLPRHMSHELATYSPPEPMPVRIESHACPRCGVRNCQRHTASFVTSGRPGGWQRFAGRA